jgi:TrmH family RNA methyltransferase
MVFDLLNNPRTASLIQQVIVSLPEYDGREEYRSKLEDALQQSENDKAFLIQLATPDVFQFCTDTMTPQGIVAVIDIPSYTGVEYNNALSDAPTESAANGSSEALHLVLDGVSDPGNVGTLLRSCLAVGVKSVILLPGCCDVWNPKAVRSAMGASFQLPIYSCESWKDGLSTLIGLGVDLVYAATMIDNEENYDDTATRADTNSVRRNSIPYHAVDWIGKNAALVIGSEGNGLSNEVRQALTGGISRQNEHNITVQATYIPMEAGIESLNAAVCGSVILFEYSRQRSLRDDADISDTKLTQN